MYARGVSAALLILGLVLGAPPNETDPDAIRLAVAPLRGKGGAACSRKIAEVLSARVRIVPLEASVEGLTSWSELSDWITKNGATDAEVVVVGSLGKKTIVLEAYATKKQKLVALGSIRTLSRCRMSHRGRAALMDWLAKILNESAPAGGSPSIERVPPPPPAKTEAEPRPPVTGREGAEVTEVAEVEKVEKVEKVEPTVRQVAVALAASIGVGRRNLSFTDARTPNLRQHQVDAMPVPSLRLEAFPFVAAGGLFELMRPLGVSADFSRAVGLSSARTEGGPLYDTVHTEVGARLFYRWPLPLDSIPATVIPQVGYHHVTFALQGAPGENEPDLPNVGYDSVSFGVGVEVPVKERVKLFGTGTYLLVLDGGEIFDAAFFENGSAWGYRVEIGMSYRIWEGLSARLVGHHLSYSLSLDPAPGAGRVAESGRDAISGIGLGFGYEL